MRIPCMKLRPNMPNVMGIRFCAMDADLTDLQSMCHNIYYRKMKMKRQHNFRLRVMTQIECKTHDPTVDYALHSI